MRVCIADCDSKTRMFLASRGYYMEFAASRDGLLSTLGDRPAFDVVIVDAKMVLAEANLLHRIRAASSSTKIIVTVGPEEDNVQEKILWDEAHAILRKPYHLGKLQLILARLSDSRTAQVSTSEITRKFRLVKLTN